MVGRYGIMRAQSPLAGPVLRAQQHTGLPLAPLLTDVNKSEDGVVLC